MITIEWENKYVSVPFTLLLRNVGDTGTPRSLQITIHEMIYINALRTLYLVSFCVYYPFTTVLSATFRSLKPVCQEMSSWNKISLLASLPSKVLFWPRKLNNTLHFKDTWWFKCQHTSKTKQWIAKIRYSIESFPLESESMLKHNCQSRDATFKKSLKLYPPLPQEKRAYTVLFRKFLIFIETLHKLFGWKYVEKDLFEKHVLMKAFSFKNAC